MKNYLDQLVEHQAFEQAAPLLPPGLCPFLFYNLTPYIFTLAHGGWFSWAKKCKQPTDRRTPTPSDFSRQNVNRLYFNETLVRCPNPDCNLVAGIGPWKGNNLALRLVHQKGECPQNYKVGETIIPCDAFTPNYSFYTRKINF